MSSETIVLVLSLIDTIGLLFFAVYYIVIPEIVCSVVLLLAFLFSLMAIPLFINLPMTAWLVYRYVGKPKGRLGIYDAAELHNRNGIKTFLKEAMVKLGYQLVCFFFYLYWLISHLVSDDNNVPSPI